MSGIRRLWQHVSPHLPQPATDDEALHTMHLARVGMKNLPQKLRTYSETWLKERETGRVIHAVGIAVGMQADWRNSRRAERFLNVRGEMEHAVVIAVNDGVDLATESVEVKKRIMTAREKA